MKSYISFDIYTFENYITKFVWTISLINLLVADAMEVYRSEHKWELPTSSFSTDISLFNV